MADAPTDDPVVIFDRDGNALVAKNCLAAAEEIESIDVADGEYHGDDADGYVLSSAELAYDEAVSQILRSESRLGLTSGNLRDLLEQILKMEDAGLLRKIRYARRRRKG